MGALYPTQDDGTVGYDLSYPVRFHEYISGRQSSPTYQSSFVFEAAEQTIEYSIPLLEESSEVPLNDVAFCCGNIV